jgi:hypothetical protein
MIPTGAIEMHLVDESVNTSNFGTDSHDLPPTHCQCLPGCSELTYRGTLSSSTMSGDFALNKEYRAKNETYFRLDKIFILLYLTHLNAMHIISFTFTRKQIT